MSEPTIFLIRPYHGGWQCFVAPGVQPFWRGDNATENAIGYARNCPNRHGAVTDAQQRPGFQIRILNAAGEIEESIALDERYNRMRV
jgi:hypothetical protein